MEEDDVEVSGDENEDMVHTGDDHGADDDGRDEMLPKPNEIM